MQLIGFEEAKPDDKVIRFFMAVFDAWYGKPETYWQVYAMQDIPNLNLREGDRGGFCAFKYTEPAWIGAGSLVGQYVTLSFGTVVGENTIVYPRARLGRKCKIGNGLVIDYDQEVPDNVVLESKEVPEWLKATR